MAIYVLKTYENLMAVSTAVLDFFMVWYDDEIAVLCAFVTMYSTHTTRTSRGGKFHRNIIITEFLALL